MPILQVAITIIVCGVLLWLVNTYVPMANPLKTLLNAFVVVVLVLWILSLFGVLDYLPRLPRR